MWYDKWACFEVEGYAEVVTEKVCHEYLLGRYSDQQNMHTYDDDVDNESHATVHNLAIACVHTQREHVVE